MLAYLTDSEKRYRTAYEALQERQEKKEVAPTNLPQLTMPTESRDSDTLMKMLVVQQFQQQSSMWQGALLQMMNKNDSQPVVIVNDRAPFPLRETKRIEEKPEGPKLRNKLYGKPTTEVVKSSMHTFPGHEKARKLRIFGYIGLLTYLVKTVDNEPPFTMTRRTEKALTLRILIRQIRDNYLDNRYNLEDKLKLMAANESYQLGQLLANRGDEKKLAPILGQAKDLLNCIIERTIGEIINEGAIALRRGSGLHYVINSSEPFPREYFYEMELKAVQVNEQNTLVKVTDVDKKAIILGLFLFRAMALEISLKSTELGYTSRKAKAETDINFKVLAALLVYVYRLTLTKLQGERMNKNPSFKPVPLTDDLETKLLPDLDMAPVLKRIGDRLLKDYVTQLQIWLNRYVQAINQLDG